MNEDVPTPADSLLAKLTATLLWLIGLIWLLPMLFSMMMLSLVIAPWKTNWLNRLYCRGQLLLTGSSWRAVVHPEVDPTQAYLFAQNHINHFDHVVLYNATPHFKQGLELESHFNYPVYGWFMKSRGTIPVRKGSQGQTPAIMSRMRSEIRRGHSILAFPEGTRTRSGRVSPFRKGVFFIARDLGIPVVPVAITGMYNVMRKGSWLIRPGYEVVVHVCKPMETKGLTDDDIPSFANAVQAEVAKHVDAYWAQQLEQS
jgi:1-acyl-sn-glycerol-3-phosphate acyltransferase